MNFQKELFLGKADLGSPPRIERSERKLSTSSTSMKTKWLKAFRSLKPATAIASSVKYVISQCFNYRARCSEPMHLLHPRIYHLKLWIALDFRPFYGRI